MWKTIRSKPHVKLVYVSRALGILIWNFSLEIAQLFLNTSNVKQCSQFSTIVHFYFKYETPRISGTKRKERNVDYKAHSRSN